MGFKDMVKSDIANVLMNTEEFAESHTVKYDGDVYEDIPIILQRVKQYETELKKRGYKVHLQEKDGGGVYG